MGYLYIYKLIQLVIMGKAETYVEQTNIGLVATVCATL